MEEILGVSVNSPRVDEIRKDCHFYRRWKDKYICAALNNFYGADGDGELCGECPFFKTPEEFGLGWARGVRMAGAPI